MELHRLAVVVWWWGACLCEMMVVGREGGVVMCVCGAWFRVVVVMVMWCLCVGGCGCVWWCGCGLRVCCGCGCAWLCVE
eukprot:1954630-Pyramimonas_sp.AAC.1